MPFVTVTKAQFAKLKGHHLDVLQYLSGGKWGCREGPVEERRAATWATLAASPDAREARVSALLWACAREAPNRWLVGQMEPYRDAVRREIEEGDTAQDRPTEGDSSGGALGNDEDMDLDDTPLALRQRRLHGAGQAGQAGRQDARPPPRENAGGHNADLGDANAANGRETLQQLRGEL